MVELRSEITVIMCDLDLFMSYLMVFILTFACWYKSGKHIMDFVSDNNE